MYDKRLDTFLAVCQYGSMSKAAKNLFVTQPVVTRKIAQLEREFDVELFYRTTQGVSPTPEGRILQEAATRLKEESDAARARIRTAREGHRSVRINSSVYMPWPRYDAARMLFKNRYPEFKIEILYSDMGEPRWTSLVDALLARKLDVALCALDESFHRSELTLVQLDTARRFCVLPPGHPLESRAALTPEDLMGYAIRLPLGVNSPSFDHLRALADERGLASTIDISWKPIQEWGAENEVYLTLDHQLPHLSSLVAIPYEDEMPPTIVGAATRKDATGATAALVECLVDTSAPIAESNQGCQLSPDSASGPGQRRF